MIVSLACQVGDSVHAQAMTDETARCMNGYQLRRPVPQAKKEGGVVSGEKIFREPQAVVAGARDSCK